MCKNTIISLLCRTSPPIILDHHLMVLDGPMLLVVLVKASMGSGMVFIDRNLPDWTALDES